MAKKQSYGKKAGLKLRRAAKHKLTGKYVRQFSRTEANLKRKGKTNKKLRGR